MESQRVGHDWVINTHTHLGKAVSMIEMALGRLIFFFFTLFIIERKVHSTVNCIKVLDSTFICLLHSVTESRVPRKALVKKVALWSLGRPWESWEMETTQSTARQKILLKEEHGSAFPCLPNSTLPNPSLTSILRAILLFRYFHCHHSACVCV